MTATADFYAAVFDAYYGQPERYRQDQLELPGASKWEGYRLPNDYETDRTSLPHIDWDKVFRLQPTARIHKAAFIAPDGKLLDKGNQTHAESVGHPDSEALSEFMSLGHIRTDPTRHAVHSATKPTDSQLSHIASIAKLASGELSLDLQDGIGKVNERGFRNTPRSWSTMYTKGTPVDVIHRDIHDFYGGKTPRTTGSSDPIFYSNQQPMKTARPAKVERYRQPEAPPKITAKATSGTSPYVQVLFPDKHLRYEFGDALHLQSALRHAQNMGRFSKVLASMHDNGLVSRVTDLNTGRPILSNKQKAEWEAESANPESPEPDREFDPRNETIATEQAGESQYAADAKYTATDRATAIEAAGKLLRSGWEERRNWAKENRAKALDPKTQTFSKDNIKTVLDALHGHLGEHVTPEEALQILNHAGIGKDTFDADEIAYDMEKAHGAKIPTKSLRMAAWQNMTENDRDYRRKDALEKAGDAKAIKFGKPGTPVHFIVHPAAHSDYKGQWQITRFDDRGPSGHQYHKTKEEAIGAAIGAHPNSYWNEGDSEYDITEKYDNTFAVDAALAYYGHAADVERYVGFGTKETPTTPLAPSEPAITGTGTHLRKSPTPVAQTQANEPPPKAATPVAIPRFIGGQRSLVSSSTAEPVVPNEPVRKLKPKKRELGVSTFPSASGIKFDIENIEPHGLPQYATPKRVGHVVHNGILYRLTVATNPDNIRKPILHVERGVPTSSKENQVSVRMEALPPAVHAQLSSLDKRHPLVAAAKALLKNKIIPQPDQPPPAKRTATSETPTNWNPQPPKSNVPSTPRKPIQSSAPAPMSPGDAMDQIVHDIRVNSSVLQDMKRQLKEIAKGPSSDDKLNRQVALQQDIKSMTDAIRGLLSKRDKLAYSRLLKTAPLQSRPDKPMNEPARRERDIGRGQMFSLKAQQFADAVVDKYVQATSHDALLEQFCAAYYGQPERYGGPQFNVKHIDNQANNAGIKMLPPLAPMKLQAEFGAGPPRHIAGTGQQAGTFKPNPLSPSKTGLPAQKYAVAELPPKPHSESVSPGQQTLFIDQPKPKKPPVTKAESPQPTAAAGNKLPWAHSTQPTQEVATQEHIDILRSLGISQGSPAPSSPRKEPKLPKETTTSIPSRIPFLVPKEHAGMTNEELAHKALQGDHHAKNTLFGRNQGLLSAAVSQKLRIPVNDERHEEAKAMLAQALVRSIHNGTYDPAKLPWKNWVFTNVTEVGSHMPRRQHRSESIGEHGVADELASSSPITQTPSRELQPDMAAERKEVIGRFRKFLKQHGPYTQWVIHNVMNDTSLNDLARVLAAPINSPEVQELAQNPDPIIRMGANPTFRARFNKTFGSGSSTSVPKISELANKFYDSLRQGFDMPKPKKEWKDFIERAADKIIAALQMPNTEAKQTAVKAISDVKGFKEPKSLAKQSPITFKTPNVSKKHTTKPAAGQKSLFTAGSKYGFASEFANVGMSETPAGQGGSTYEQNLSALPDTPTGRPRPPQQPQLSGNERWALHTGETADLNELRRIHAIATKKGLIFKVRVPQPATAGKQQMGPLRWFTFTPAKWKERFQQRGRPERYGLFGFGKKTTAPPAPPKYNPPGYSPDPAIQAQDVPDAPVPTGRPLPKLPAFEPRPQSSSGGGIGGLAMIAAGALGRGRGGVTALRALSGQQQSRQPTASRPASTPKPATPKQPQPTAAQRKTTQEFLAQQGQWDAWIKGGMKGPHPGAESPVQAESPTAKKTSQLTPEQQKRADQAREDRSVASAMKAAQFRKRQEAIERGEAVPGRRGATRPSQPASIAQVRADLNLNKTPVGKPIPMLKGTATQIHGEGIKPVQGHYAVVDLSDLKPSHIGDKDERISENPDYKTKSDQPRDYSPGSENHKKVLRHLSDKVHSYWTTDNPDALAGPSTIDEEGQVSNGNGRAIVAMIAAHKGDYKWLKDAVVNKAPQYGFTPEQVSDMQKMEHPYLVRVHPSIKSGTDEFGLFAAAGNKETRQTELPVREAASIGKTVINDKELSDLADQMTGDVTLGQVLNKQNHPLVARLRDAIQNTAAYNKFFTGDKLHEQGRNLVEDMVLSKFIDPAILENPAETRSLKNALGTAVPHLIRIGPEIKKPLEKAFDYIATHPQVKTLAHLRDDTQRQKGLFEKGNEVDETAKAILEEMYKTKTGSGSFSGPAIRTLFHEIAKAATDRRRDTSGRSLLGAPTTSWLDDAIRAVNQASRRNETAAQPVQPKPNPAQKGLFTARTRHDAELELYSQVHLAYYGGMTTPTQRVARKNRYAKQS